MDQRQRLDFTDQTVMVTGASRGIGCGVARVFARQGATLHILSQGEEVITEEISAEQSLPGV